MNPTGFPLRRSPSSSDRLLRVLTLSPPSSNASVGDELNEAELLWSVNVAEAGNRRPASPKADRKRRLNFDRPRNSGIVDLLKESDCHTGGGRGGSVLCRKPCDSPFSSASRMIPSTPRPGSESPQETEPLAKSAPGRKFQQSAPVNVPVPSNVQLAYEDDDVDDDAEMLPPHELVAKGSGVTPKTTFSVLEGVGRTLKGRDLRQVRNAIWRKTGFLG